MIKYKGYTVECDTLDELLEAVKSLPNTIKYLNVQSNLCYFNPESIKINWSKDLIDKVDVIIEEALQEQEQFGYVDKFCLSSYFGEGKADHPYYIKLESERSRNFADYMSKGSFGKLD